ncbi:MAG: hypothetical protein U0176_08425 [Bacteroidia bacterium]
MRKLNPNEFTFHPQLVILAEQRPATDPGHLFVSYEYRRGGEVYQVGDFTYDPGKQANDLNSNVLFLKNAEAGQDPALQQQHPSHFVT